MVPLFSIATFYVINKPMVFFIMQKQGPEGVYTDLKVNQTRSRLCGKGRISEPYTEVAWIPALSSPTTFF